MLPRTVLACRVKESSPLHDIISRNPGGTSTFSLKQFYLFIRVFCNGVSDLKGWPNVPGRCHTVPQMFPTNIQMSDSGSFLEIIVEPSEGGEHGGKKRRFGGVDRLL